MLETHYRFAADKENGGQNGKDNGAPAAQHGVQGVDNRIYFYGDVKKASVMELNRLLHEKSVEIPHVYAKNEISAEPEIRLHINSYGGYVFDGLAAIDAVCRAKKQCRVVTIVDGACASAATTFSVAGTERLMGAHSFMLIHQIHSVFWGTYEEFKDEKENLDMLMRCIKDIYKTYTRVPMEEIDKILKHDLWWDAETCVEYGLVDGII